MCGKSRLFLGGAFHLHLLISLHVGVKFVRHVGAPEVAVSRWLTVSKMASVHTKALYLCQEAVDCCKSRYTPGSKAEVYKTSLVECRSAG